MMFLIVVFLMYLITSKAAVVNVESNFFDKNNSNAMRGFWCLVVVMVHVPSVHGNIIQDLISSFGFIGVTFFFLTSSYGLTLAMNKRNNLIKSFWRKRLPKLFITCWVTNIIYMLTMWVIADGKMSWISIFEIDIWVRWMIACYIFFWISHILLSKKPILCNLVICISIAVFSLCFYLMQFTGKYTKTVWSTEIFGFIWGILLAWSASAFYNFFREKWIAKMGASFVAGIILGGFYLQFKYVPFYGDYLLKILLGFSITLFVLISNVKLKYGNKISNFLGEISFEIYLLHQKVFIIVDSITNGKLSSGIFIIVCLIVTCVLAYITHIFVVWMISLLKKYSALAVD